MLELIELRNLLAENKEMTRNEKITLMIESLMEQMPLAVQLLVKANLSMVTHYIDNVGDEEMDMCLDTLADILQDIRGC